MKNKNSGQKLWEKAKKIIPGGNQLLSKRAEMFLPDGWPAYYKKAKGIEVTDLDGKKYLDFSLMGVGSCILGYADPDINKAVKKAIDDGSMSTLNCPEEVELAEKLLALHPWPGMVRFARTGGEANAIALRIARVYSGKDKVAFCGYHGWHDWYLSSNLASDENLDGHLLPGLEPKGVPRGLLETALPFRYNHLEELEAIVKRHDIGVIFLEAIRHDEPENNFLERVRKIASRIGAVLIFDEVSSGFRDRLGGAYTRFGVEPDMVVYGKALGNGFPITAIVGRKEIMDAAQKTFISSTLWTERIGPVAALAVMKKFKKENVASYIKTIGAEIGKGWRELAKKHGLNIDVHGPEYVINFAFNYDNAQELKTLFIQEMLDLGFLSTNLVYVTFAHKKSHVKNYLKAVDKVFGILKTAINKNDVKSRLRGPVAHTGFHRLT
ncbi:MAG: aminotransferase class III-fold pyridoxal phosphate-dependent enzyme [Candidatus Zambryskibacteria bacterium]